ncbi:MAG: DEAD/DEAH box helicase [Clostridia bacterium]|nr:DEAD/DEAH box helicase [Clostridia bacterium]
MDIKDVKLIPEIKKAIDELGYESWTEIQEKTIPLLSEGLDVIGQSQTGTGKTMAFGIPLLQKINQKSKRTQVIVLSPTRELAVQTAGEMRKITKYMQGVKIVCVYGGEEITRQIRDLKGGAQIIVATPGRLIDHINRKTIKLDDCNVVVLDEADEMLKMGFREDIETILSSLKEERQTVLFSATMPKPIMDLTKMYQKDPVHIKVEPKFITANTVKQEYCELKGKHKSEAASRILKVNNVNLAIIFCNTKEKVDRVNDELLKKGFAVDKIHGDLTQNLRLKVLKKLEDGLIKILVATDVAARGLDIKNVELVLNYDVPEKEEYYVHRIGRSGRAGKAGHAVTLVGEKDKARLRAIEKYIKKDIEKVDIPTLDQVKEHNLEKYISDINKKINKEERKGEIFSRVLKELRKEHGLEEITLALLAMNLKLTDEYEINDINLSEKDIKRNDRRDRDKERAKDKKSNTRKAKLKDGKQRIFLNVGRCHGAKKMDLLRAIEKETGVKKNFIDDMEVFENFTFFTVDDRDTKKIIKGVEGKKFNKIKMKAEKAKR